MCQIRREQTIGGPTLGLFKPFKITRLKITPTSSDWTPKQKTILNQNSFGFQNAPKEALQKIPFEFTYQFRCDDADCNGHEMDCTDWEMSEAYRDWSKKYGAEWKVKFLQTFERDMISRYDTHFYVGTLHQHPKNWQIVGLFYPPRKNMDDLFDV
jgi:hypothetical protein